MTEYYPPISTRETDELISIANGTTNDWQESAIGQAKDELTKRGITQDYQNEVLNKWKEQDRQLEIEYQKQLILNETEGYSKGKMIYIFLVAPFIFSGKFSVDLSLSELKKLNYKRKRRHRIILLISGTLAWVLYLVLIANIYKNKRQADLKEAEIRYEAKTKVDRTKIKNDSTK